MPTVRLLAALPLLLALTGLSGDASRADPGDARLLGRVAVREDGFVRVSADRLRELGAPDAKRVSVTRHGEAVAVSRSGETRDLVFLARNNATSSSAWAVYELWAHETEIALPVAPRGDPARPLEPARARRRQDRDHLHGPLAAARIEVYAAPGTPTWFLAQIPAGAGASIDLDPMHAKGNTPQTLEVEVYASRIGEVALAAAWGEVSLGTQRVPHAAGGARLRWAVPAGAVPAEGTALVLTDISPPPPPAPSQDVSWGRGTLWIDAVTLSGPVTRHVGPGLRVFDVKPERRLVLEVPVERPDLHLALVAPTHGFLGRPTVTVDAADPAIRTVSVGSVPEGTRLYASTHAAHARPNAATRPPDPVESAGNARHLILAVPELVEAAKILAAHRTASGTPSVVVPVTDVYDTYGGGEYSADAIQRFLLDRMRRAPLDYVLLVGDATLDRTDLTIDIVIPARWARTIYNGATPADSLYAKGPAIGRLPFRDAADLRTYVRRVIAYESEPPAHSSRRLLRFVTNEARFGAGIDFLLEQMFRGVVATHIPPAFDVEVTFASSTSPYLWPPPQFNAKVIDGFNEGCLFYTYVGHGFARGFDELRVGDRRYPVLHVDQVGDVECRNTPPIVFCLACTTAKFDHPTQDGIGEALLKQPGGPVAYWGATRICHPAANTLLGRAIPRFLTEGKGRRRLGDILARANAEILAPTETGAMRLLIDQAIRRFARGIERDRLALEATWMYVLLGDPALAVAFPKEDLTVSAHLDADRVIRVRVSGPLPAGTTVRLSLEVPRNRRAHEPESVSDPTDPASFARIRANHRRVNDLALDRTEVVVPDGKPLRWSKAVPDTFPGGRLVVKAWATSGDDVHQGATVLQVPARPSEAAPEDGGD